MGCLEWTGYRDKDGYGNIQIAGSPYRVHRIVWMQDNGHTDLFVLHSCDNPACYNIEHLFAGTAADNTRDMIEKGRGAEQKVTHCPAGHPYDGDNLVIRYNGYRRCRECHKEMCRKSRASETHDRRTTTDDSPAAADHPGRLHQRDYYADQQRLAGERS